MAGSNWRWIFVAALLGVCCAGQIFFLFREHAKLVSVLRAPMAKLLLPNDLNHGKKQNGAAGTTAHVVYSADDAQFVGMKASITSLVINTATPLNVTIHVFRQSTKVATTMETHAFSELAKWVKHMGASIEMHDFVIEEAEPFVNSHFNLSDRGNLQSPGNYVRFLLPSKLPDVESCLWIDSDTIVRGDVVPFLRARRGSDKAISAFPRANSGLPENSWKVLGSLGADVASSRPSFNAGIIRMNLRLWRTHDSERKIAQLCKWNEELNLWPGFGSQPPLQILFGGDRFEQLDRSLYVDGLGWKQNARIKENSLFLHWNGEKKPWLPTGAYKEHWEAYNWDKLDQILAK